MAAGVAAGSDPESFRIPLIITNRTYAYAALVALGSGTLSALLVRRQVDRLDLIEVLKTRS
jgi:putative ABC transport system permease protein